MTLVGSNCMKYQAKPKLTIGSRCANRIEAATEPARSARSHGNGHCVGECSTGRS